MTTSSHERRHWFSLFITKNIYTLIITFHNHNCLSKITCNSLIRHRFFYLDLYHPFVWLSTILMFGCSNQNKYSVIWSDCCIITQDACRCAFNLSFLNYINSWVVLLQSSTQNINLLLLWVQWTKTVETGILKLIYPNVEFLIIVIRNF